MSDTANFLQPGTEDAPGYDVSSHLTPSAPPPSYDDEEQQPPSYSAALEMYPPPKEGPDYVPEPTESSAVSVMIPEGSPDTTQPVVLSAFDDKTVRRAFVRKVFYIVILMLLFTFSVVFSFTFSSEVKEAMRGNLGAYIPSYVIFLTVLFALSYFNSFSRRHPWNIVGLVLVTLSMSYMMGAMASYHNTPSVVISIGVTLAITVAIIVFSAQTRIDFTACNGVMLILALDLVMFGIVCTFYYSHVASVGYGCLGALLFSLFLMLDVLLQTVSMSNRPDPEEYVYAALTIFLDIPRFFLFVLGRK